MKNRRAVFAESPRAKHPERRAAPALEWLSDVSGATARLTLLGGERLLVENHCGLKDFSPERILLGAHSGEIEVLGRGLTLWNVRRDALIIRGAIEAVHLPCREVPADE